jgi:hypothetical protein
MNPLNSRLNKNLTYRHIFENFNHKRHCHYYNYQNTLFHPYYEALLLKLSIEESFSRRLELIYFVISKFLISL